MLIQRDSHCINNNHHKQQLVETIAPIKYISKSLPHHFISLKSMRKTVTLGRKRKFTSRREKERTPEDQQINIVPQIKIFGGCNFISLGSRVANKFITEHRLEVNKTKPAHRTCYTADKVQPANFHQALQGEKDQIQPSRPRQHQKRTGFKNCLRFKFSEITSVHYSYSFYSSQAKRERNNFEITYLQL